MVLLKTKRKSGPWSVSKTTVSRSIDTPTIWKILRSSNWSWSRRVPLRFSIPRKDIFSHMPHSIWHDTKMLPHFLVFIYFLCTWRIALIVGAIRRKDDPKKRMLAWMLCLIKDWGKLSEAFKIPLNKKLLNIKFKKWYFNVNYNRL